MKAIILAGWFATRLWPLTEKRAKPLLLLNNKEVISHIIEKIPEQIWVEKIEIIISTNAVFKSDFEKYLQKNNFWDKKISIFIEDSFWDEWKKWALWATSLLIQKEKINEDIFLIAWDNYFWFDFEKFTEEILKNKENPTIVWYDFWKENIEKCKLFWVIIPDEKNQNFVKKFQEKPINPESSLVSTWFYFFPKRFLKDIIFYSEKNPDNLWWIFEYFLQKNEKIKIFKFNDFWFDIWSFRDYIEAHKILQKENFFSDKWEELKKNILWNKNILNEENFFWKWVKIFNSKIKNSIILDNCEIKNCELKNCIIDKNCKLNNLELFWKILRENSEI